MESKKVSAIIPFYNGVEWLCEAVESVINQTYKNIEIVVVNDGSKEDMSPFLNKYGDRVIYEYQQNQGPAAARNRAMEIATGDYFAFLDSDDIWLPEKIELQLKLMDVTGAMWSHHGFKYFWPSGKEKKMMNSEDYGQIYGKFAYSIGIGTLCVIVDRKVFVEHPELKFPIEMKKGQDTWLWKHIAEFYPIALLDNVLGKVRMRGSNSSTRAILRFNLMANNYLKQKKNRTLPLIVRINGPIYLLYFKLFGKKENAIKEFIAKCFWIIPYVISRVGLMLWLNKHPRNKRYRLKVEDLKLV